tara:strand:+ start:124 stop:534 length:411 start_codon:yes stop_codon:yes gene_type:complete
MLTQEEKEKIHRDYNKQNIVFHHNPNSFFYMSAIANQDMPTDAECQALNPDYESSEWIEKCSPDNFPDNKTDCKNVAFCKNVKRVNELYDKRNDYSATGQLYLDNNEEYKESYNRLISLSVGIAFFTYVTVKKIFQ